MRSLQLPGQTFFSFLTALLLLYTSAAPAGRVYGQPAEELTISTPEYIDATYEKALEAFYLQEYETSLAYIRHVIRADMSNYQLRYLAAHNHWKLGNFESAEAHFKAAIQASPAEPGSYIDYALMLIHQRKYGNARSVAAGGVKTLEQAGQKNPKLYNVLARSCLLAGDWPAALHNAEKAKGALDANEIGVKDKLESMVIEARVHMAMGQYEKAELSLLWASSLKENNPYVQNLLGYLYTQWSLAEEKSNPPLAEDLRKKAEEMFAQALDNTDTLDEFKPVIQENVAALVR